MKVDGVLVPSSFTICRHLLGRGADLQLVTINVRFDLRERRWRAGAVEIQTTPGARPEELANLADCSRSVDPEDLRYVADQLVSTVELALVQLPRMFELADAANTSGAEDEIAWPTAVRKRQRRREVSRSLLVEVAMIYRDAPRYPRRAVQDHYGVSAPTASRWIAEAREQGLLYPLAGKAKSHAGG